MMVNFVPANAPALILMAALGGWAGFLAGRRWGRRWHEIRRAMLELAYATGFRAGYAECHSPDVIDVEAQARKWVASSLRED